MSPKSLSKRRWPNDLFNSDLSCALGPCPACRGLPCLWALHCRGRGRDIAANSSLDDAVAAIEAAWKQEGQPQQVVMLGDILGATPCNAACAWLSLHPEINACGLTGVSVPMMLKAFTYRELSPQELVEKLADTVSRLARPLPPVA